MSREINPEIVEKAFKERWQTLIVMTLFIAAAVAFLWNVDVDAVDATTGVAPATIISTPAPK